MKPLALLILTFFAMLAPGGDPIPEPQAPLAPAPFDSTACSPFYPFQGGWYNLETLQYIDAADGLPSTDFKQCSPFAHRFTNPISDTVRINGVEFAIENNEDKKKYRLHISGKGIRTAIINLPVADPLPEVHEYYIHLLPYKKDVIVMIRDFYSTHYTLCKYNAEGKELLRDSLEHTYVTHPNPNTNHHHPYLNLADVTASQLVFSSHAFYADTARTVLVSMDDFSKQEFQSTAMGSIPDEREENLAGFASASESELQVTLLNGTTARLDLGEEARTFSLILRGDLLFVANYFPIATGSSLQCFNIRSQKRVWKADVAQVNAEHSEYENHVVLSLYKNKVVMEGIEASGSYLQVFDAETGARLAKWGFFWPLEFDR